MPLAPHLRKYYSRRSGWPELCQLVLARAGQTADQPATCECLGECGFRHPGGRCDAPDRMWVARCRHDATLWTTEGVQVSNAVQVAPEGCYLVLIRLQVAHRDHEPRNRDLSNLAAWCQRCHLSHDWPHHHQTATHASLFEARKAGQQRLFQPVQLPLFDTRSAA